MAEIPHETAAQIKQYGADARVAEENYMQVDSQNLEARLDETIRELQSRVTQQRQQLNQLRAEVQTPFSTRPSQDKRERLQQLRILKASYDRLADEEPSLPPKDSALPAVLATRLIQDTVAATKSGIAESEAQLLETSARLSTEVADLDDARALTAALENRLDRLRRQHEERSQKSASQAARENLKNEQRKKREYEKQTKSLSRSLTSFIDDHLAGMLAAEELGGPVVGDMMDIDDDDLAAGFSSQGRVKKNKTLSDSSRQRRIDEIWGSATADVDAETTNEKDAAGAEFKALFKQLYRASLGQSDSGDYVSVEKESAAARFLVRAKLAQYHPKDARRLRLIDFGRELDE